MSPTKIRVGIVVALSVLAFACKQETDKQTDDEDLEMQDEDFDCIKDGTAVRKFFVANRLGHLDEALAVARREIVPPYPAGTIIQLVPFEAMVKRGGRFDPENDDWEYLVIDPTSGSTNITARGTEEVINVGVPCFACHSAAKAVDYICESGNGCPELMLSDELVDFLQESDPRCP